MRATASSREPSARSPPCSRCFPPLASSPRSRWRVIRSFGARNVTTDQRLADVGAMWFGYATDPSLPLKLRDNESLGGFQYALVLERWTTVGAQVHPAPNVVISMVVLQTFLAENRVVYVAGASGDRIFVVQLLSSA